MNCWFCDAIEENKNKSLHLKLYGEVGATEESESVTQVKYVLHEIDVPRCGLCKAKHSQARLVRFISFVLLLVVTALSVITAFGIISGMTSGLLIGLSAGLMVGTYSYSLALHKGIKSVSAAKKIHPEVKELLNKGYKFGKGIKDHTKEVKPAAEETKKDPEPLVNKDTEE